MPKAVMRSGATAPSPAASQAAPKPAAQAVATPAAPAPTAAAPVAAPAAPAPTVAAPATASDPMRDRLKAMGLSDEAIEAAMSANAANKAAVPKTVTTPTAAPAQPKATTVAAPVTAAPAAQPVQQPAPTPAPATENAPAQPAAAEPVSDEEYVATMGVEDQPEVVADVVAPTAQPAGAAPDHEDDPAAGDPATGTMVVQNHWSQASGGALSGAIDRSDFKTPQLKIIQGNSPATVNYSQGDLVFCDQVIFGPPTGDKPSPFMRFIPVQVQKYFREELPKGSKLKPRNVLTPDEVRRLGGTTEWTVDRAGKRVKPTWSPAARCTIIIEQPEGVEHPAFSIPVEVNGAVKMYAAAVYYVNGGAYRSFAKPIIDACSFILCEGDKIVLEKRMWKMQTVKETSGEFTVFVPKVAIVNEATPPDLRAFAASLRG